MASNHASYAKIGLTVMLGVAAIIGALVYLGGAWGSDDRVYAETYTDRSVSGLSVGSAVNFRGVKLGEVKEITFVGQPVKIGEAGNPFSNAGVVVTGTVNGMNRKDITELLTLLGAYVSDSVTKNTTYLIVGEAPGAKKLAAALSFGTKIITEGHFTKMLAESAVEE